MRKITKAMPLILILLLGFCPVASAEKIFKMGWTFSPDHPTSKGAELAVKIIKEKTKGEIDIRTFPLSKLGTEEEMCEAVILGSLDMYIGGAGQIGNYFKPLNVLEMPYTFKNNQHVLKFGNSDIGKNIFEDLRIAYGVKVVAVTSWGLRHVTSNKPIKTPENLKGFKLRVPQQSVCIEYAKAMGANPTPIALAETYLALQQGVADGMESPMSALKAMKFYEVQKYINLTGHVINCVLFLMNDKKFASLTPEQQDIFQKAFDEGARYGAKGLDEEQETLSGFFEKEGLTIVKSDLKAFQEATAGMPKKNSKYWIKYGEDLHKTIQNMD
jgi:tripartite ATP-independent transporter DctP family solute receptor